MIKAGAIKTAVRSLIAGHGRPSVITTVVAAGILAGTTAATAAVSLTSAPPEAPAQAEPAPSIPTTPEFREVPADVVAVRQTAALAPPAAEGPERIDDIPLVALTAYQRAEAVINTADPRCQVRWTLIAAVGRVLTDHGERGEQHRITNTGRVLPALVGPTLRSTDGRPAPDSDGGRLDADRAHDHAVGPMLIDPPTWSVVGVDGDSDGHRNPQDVDDAALATAVRLCSGSENLRRLDDRRSAVRVISKASGFARVVLEVEAAYLKDVRTRPLVALPPIPVEDLPEFPPLVPIPGVDPLARRDGDSNTPNGADLPRPSGDPSRPGGAPSPSYPPTDPPTETPTDPPTETPTDPPTETPTDPPTETPTDPSTDPSPTETSSATPSDTPTP